VAIGLCVIFPACGSQPPVAERSNGTDDEIIVRVDPRVELFSTIHRLAGTGQYDSNELQGYIRDVEEHFGSFRDHRAVALARELRRTHSLDGNSPMALAVYLTDPPELEGRATLNPPPDDLDRRWTADTIPGFLEAAREFVRDTDFQSFFDTHHDLYAYSVANLRSMLTDTNMLPWFQDFFGYQPDDFVIILGLQNGTCNYGASVTLEKGHREFNSLLGASRPDRNGAPRYQRRWHLPIIVHEFCHSYTNPLVDRHKESLREAGESLFPHLKAQLGRWGYNTWFVMMYEYLTRACVLRYLAANESERAAEDRIRVDEEAGFPGIRGLASLLGEYETQRDAYSDLDAFMPRIAAYFAGFAESFR
jgi:hypothetical protein